MGGSTEDPTDPPIATEHLPEIVITASKGGMKFSDMFRPDWISTRPDWLLYGETNSWTSSFNGSLSDYNNTYGTNYTSHQLAYNDWNYTFNWLPKQLDNIKSIHDATGKAAEAVSYILPMGPALQGVGLLARGGGRLLMKGLSMSRRYVFRKTVLTLAKPHPFLYRFSEKTLRYGHGQLDAGHRASAFLHKEIIMKGKFIFRKSDKAFIFNYTTSHGQNFSVGINPMTRRIFHQAPGLIK